MRGPSASRTVFGDLSSAARSSAAKPPSGPIRTASGNAVTLSPAPRLHQRGNRVLHLGLLVAEHQEAGGGALAEHLLQRPRLADVRQCQDTALFGRLDGIRPQALEIDARDLGVPREDRLRGPTRLAGALTGRRRTPG